MRMKNEKLLSQQESLDPADWDALKSLGHKMIDDMFDYLQKVRERPVWKPIPAETKQHFRNPLPSNPQPAEDVYKEFVHHVLPYTKGNIHPRFWSWVEGGGTPLGMLADMLAAGMNPNNAIGDHAAVYVENQVIDWSKQMFGFPSSATGILLSGGSIANITALITARNHYNKNIRTQGLNAVNGRLVVYASAETHNCVTKAVEIIGVGSEYLRLVPVDEDYKIRTDLLRTLIANDKQAGLLPFCIIGNAGTVNTGAIDDLDELALISRQEGCWFHVDGAFGAIPKLLPEFEKQLSGIEKADSLAFDFHKWLYVNYEVGCVLIRDGEAHKRAFSVNANYLLSHEKGLAAGPEPFSNFGMELSRGFKALKVWMSLKEHGIEKYKLLVRQNLEQARFLAQLVQQTENFELLAATSLNIICFRYNPGDHSDEELNTLNKNILMELQERGIAAPSYTLLQNRYAIRVAITNHRSRLEDFEILIDGVRRIGEVLHKKNYLLV
jgi:aromatic-L-amino-acid/L-tryptophan decarboxylase